MSPDMQLAALLERLRQKENENTLEIELVTARIDEHRKARPSGADASSSVYRLNEYRLWWKISCRLHQRRSELKTERDKLLTRLRAVEREIEALQKGLSGLQVCPDAAFGVEPALADVRA